MVYKCMEPIYVDLGMVHIVDLPTLLGFVFASWFSGAKISSSHNDVGRGRERP